MSQKKHEIEDRIDDLRDQLATERDKDNPNERRCDDLCDEIQELEDRIEDIEYRDRVEQQRLKDRDGR